LKDLQPSKSEKTNRPRLGILQKKLMGYPFSQRKNNWSGHVVRRATDTAQSSLYAAPSEQPKKTARAAGSLVSAAPCAILSLIDYTLTMMSVPDISKVDMSKKIEGWI
jgi:hypothetical protein